MDQTHPRRSRRRPIAALAALATSVALALAACGDLMTLEIDAVTPSFGAAASQTVIMGRGFSGDATVTVGGAEAAVVAVVDNFGQTITGFGDSGRRITVIVPLLTEGPKDVTVTQRNGTVTLANAFTYVAPVADVVLELDGIAPASGGAGTAATITGTDLMGSATVTVCDEPAEVVAVRDLTGTPIIAQGTNGVTLDLVMPDLRTDAVCDVAVIQPSGTATLVGAFTFTTPDPAPVRVNAGGAAFTTVGGVDFAADIGFVGGVPESNPTGRQPGDVAATSDGGLYLTYRRAPNGASEAAPGLPFGYEIDAPKIGTYTVTLHFAELFWGVEGGAVDNNEPGNRVFDVALEGAVVLDDFDLRVVDLPATAITRSFPVLVEDGTLNLDITSVAGNGMVAAIEVEFGTP